MLFPDSEAQAVFLQYVSEISEISDLSKLGYDPTVQKNVI